MTTAKDADLFRFHKEQLLIEVESTADWRARKAEEYPDDPRNDRSAKALAKLARRLSRIKSDHPTIRALAEFWEREDTQAEQIKADLTDEQSRYIGRYGFDYPEDGDPVGFLQDLQDLVAAVRSEEAA